MEINTLLTEYKNDLTHFEKMIKDITDGLNAIEYSNLTGTINSTGSSNTMQDCKNLCTDTPGCISASYNSNSSSNNCALFNEDSTINTNTILNEKEDVALVSNLKYKIYLSENLNTKIKDLNTKIDNLLSSNTYQQIDANAITELRNKYIKLNIEKKQMINKSKNINDKYTNDVKFTLSNTIQYMIWVIFAIIILSITIILFAVPNINILERIPLLILFIILLIIYFLYNYFTKIKIPNVNEDVSYLNKLDYFNY